MDKIYNVNINQQISCVILEGKKQFQTTEHFIMIKGHASEVIKILNQLVSKNAELYIYIYSKY